MDYFLSEEAKRQISKMKRDVALNSRRINRLSGTGPRVGQQTYARLGTYDTSNVGYAATEVFGDGAVDWTDIDNGREWGSDATHIGHLYSIDSTVGDSTGVHPVFRFSDGTQTYWGFIPHDSGDDETIAFGHYLDEAGKIRFYEGEVNIGPYNQAITEAAGGWDLTNAVYYVEWDGTFTFADGDDYTIKPEIQTAESMPTFYELDNTDHIVKWPLVEVDDGEVIIHWHGDINGFGLGETDGSDFEYIGAIEDDGTDGVDFIFNTRNDLFRRGRRMGVLNDETTGKYNMNAAEWTQVEQQNGGVLWLHNNSPVEDESDARHWVKFHWDSTGGLEIDDIPVDEINIWADIYGHPWQYSDGTTINGQPGAPTDPDDRNARYVGCNQAGAIVIDSSVGAVIQTGEQCWIFDTFTDQAANATSEGAFADCTSCENSLEVTKWLKCDDDAFAADLGEVYISDDYAWLCLAAVLVRCYDSGEAPTGEATEPSYLLQCGETPPTSCEELVGWPASDDFGGAGCNSATIGDANWDRRWSRNTTGSPDVSITGGVLRIRCEGGGGSQESENITNMLQAHAGDFKFEALCSNMTMVENGFSGFTIYIQAGASFWIVAWVIDATVVKQAYYDGGWNTVAGTLGATTKLRIQRVGTAIDFYVDDVSIHSIVSAASMKFNLSAFGGGEAGEKVYVDFDSITAVDGASADIYIDPTGEAC